MAISTTSARLVGGLWKNIEICSLFKKTYFAFLSTMVVPLQNIK